MPRHNPGDPPGTEPGRADRRLAAAVRPGPGTGLLDGPPFVCPSPGQRDPGPDESPVRSARIRWRTGRRAAALLCLLATGFLGWFWWQAANATAEVSPLSSIHPTETSRLQDPEPEAGHSTGASTAPDNAPGEGEANTRESIIVHVAGAVVRAGIVELPRGSRLHEAIAAAGGGAPGADPDQLNLAAVLEDGQKVLVPSEGETIPAAAAPTGDVGARGSPGNGTAPSGGKINLNTAGAGELATLPRVGPVLAQRIVDWRQQHGDFQRVEELDAVDGFGPKLLEGLLPLVRV
ncbi:helix-hairpin-helix domain-containing protein [Arthrobacter sp. UYEF36]|uniref:ComEA family DNA-binding protein n=1 Tax=Arthrobacter sp. UYEF36 TaxID=1756366 RepID=UPI0033941ED8